jgi:hypothetical protein
LGAAIQQNTLRVWDTQEGWLRIQCHDWQAREFFVSAITHGIKLHRIYNNQVLAQVDCQPNAIGHEMHTAINVEQWPT